MAIKLKNYSEKNLCKDESEYINYLENTLIPKLGADNYLSCEFQESIHWIKKLQLELVHLNHSIVRQR